MICQRIENCSEESRQRTGAYVDSKGGKSKYVIDNKGEKTFSKVDFEECVFANEPEDTKCDIGFLTDKNFYFVELKGSDVKKGIEQLLATILVTQRCFVEKEKKARLVVSKFPAPKITKNTKAYKDLMKKVGNDLIIKQNVYTEII
ncbi:MAG: hypothetical protein GC178_05600 [Flavobacteriales bacterium]|nr:hypothetical protein [Flavobacteriales bacterium]